MQKRTLIIILAAAIIASGLTGFQVGRWSQSAVYGAELEGERLKREQAEAEKAAAEAAAKAVEERLSVEAAAQAEEEEQTAEVAAQTEETAQAEEQTAQAEGQSEEEDDTEAITTILGEARIMAEMGGDEEEHEEIVKDPAYLENPELEFEPYLPDGVVSTLFNGEPEMQIVVLGDSQIGNFKGKDGIAYLLSRNCRANVYNLAMGGTAAALLPTDYSDNGNWDSRCLAGMVKVLTGQISPDLFAKYSYTYDIYNSCDLAKTDIFVIEYGANDYFQKSILGDSGNYENLKTFIGAINYSIRQLAQHFPNAMIIVATPTYARFYNSSTHEIEGTSDYLSNGVASLCVYARSAALVAYQLQYNGLPVRCFNAYDESFIKAGNADLFLLDGIHLNEYGRYLYADILSRVILRAKGYEVSNEEELLSYQWLKE